MKQANINVTLYRDEQGTVCSHVYKVSWPKTGYVSLYHLDHNTAHQCAATEHPDEKGIVIYHDLYL